MRRLSADARTIAIIGLLAFLGVRAEGSQVPADLPPPPAPTREVFAGEPYSETFRVSCVVGGVADVVATVSPNLFQVLVNPLRVTPGTLVTVSAMVPLTTPSRPYQITLSGIRRDGDCGSGSESFTLFVKRPVTLVLNPSSQMTSPGTATSYRVMIRKRTFTGPVTLRTSDLPSGFIPTFTPPTTTGTISDLSLQTPANPTQCFPPEGCLFKVRGQAGVEVEPADARITLSRKVSLQPDRTSATVAPGDEALFSLRVVRLGYTGPVDLAVTAMEQPPGGMFTTRVSPMHLTTEDAFSLGITIDPSAPGHYTFQVKPANTGVSEPPVVLTVDANGGSIAVTPATQTIDKGQQAQYDIQVVQSGSEQIRLQGAEVNPIGPTAEVSAEFSRLIVHTDSMTAARTYQLTVVGVVTSDSGTRTVRSKPVDLVVKEVAGGSVRITVDPAVRDIVAGNTISVPIDVIGVDGYAGQVTLNLSPDPAPGGVTAILNTRVVDVAPGTLSLSALRLGTTTNTPSGGPYSLTISGMPNPPAPVQSATVQYQVIAQGEPALDFAYLSPTEVVGRSGARLDLLVGARRLNGCEGPISFTYGVSPPNAVDRFAFLPSGDVATATTRLGQVASVTDFNLTVTISAPPPCRSASQTITGRIGPPLMIPPLVTATLAPAGQSIQRGQSAVYTLTLARGDTTGPITIAVTGLPASITATVQPNPVTGDSAQITLATGSATPTGTFPITVTATAADGTQVATATAGLTVNAATGNDPTISFFNPTNGSAGTAVQITGTNFINVQNVLFNGFGAAFATITQTQINATVPSFATTGPITVVTAAGTAISGTSFTVGGAAQGPQITGFAPASGAAGTVVQLQGVNLSGAFDVSIGTPTLGYTTTGFTSINANQINVIIPAGAVSGFFRVSTPGGIATSANAFQITTPNLPEIGGFNPISGPPGTSVEITGANLGGATQVSFGGAVAQFDPPQANRVVATVPPNAATGQIRITTPNGTATSFGSFAVTSGGPVITDFQPRSGSVGFSVTIAGASLTGTSDVTFNGVHATIGIVTANFVQAFVPNGATTGLIRLVTPNGSAISPIQFMVQP